MTKPLIAALATTASLFAAGAAQAGGHVQWSVGVNLPSVSTVISNFPVPVLPTVVVHQAPVVVHPAPRVVYQREVVVVPQPVVVHQPVRVVHGKWAAPVEYRRGGDRDRDGIPNRYDRVDNRWHGPYGDRDRDGIPNRYDRVDNRWHGPYADRDRDSIPNRYDRVDNRWHGPYADRDRDGVPNRYDPRDDRKRKH